VEQHERETIKGWLMDYATVSDDGRTYKLTHPQLVSKLHQMMANDEAVETIKGYEVVKNLLSDSPNILAAEQWLDEATAKKTDYMETLLITVWGTMAVVLVKPGEMLDASQALAADGGCVTVVTDHDGRDFWLDDEGLLKAGAQTNYVATKESGYGGGALAGNALVARHDDEGGSIGLTEADITYYRGRYDVEPGTLTVEEALGKAGEWWPTRLQRLEIDESEDHRPLPVPPIQIISLD